MTAPHLLTPLIASMPLRITILSGDRQGQHLEFDQDQIEIGDRLNDDVQFDPKSNPGIHQRRATLKYESGGWIVCCTGDLPIFLNQEVVEDSADLKSGDFLRMSHDGPDLSCELIGQLSPMAEVLSSQPQTTQAATPTPQPPTVSVAPSHASPEPDATVATSTRPGGLPWIPIFGAVALVAVLIPSLYWLVSKDPATTSVAPELSPFGVIVIEEGKQVFWRPTLVQSDPSDRFELGDNAPAEMTIDASTGTIRWQTTEVDGPAEYRCELIVTRSNDPSQRDSDWLEIKVEEVNRLPELEEIPTQSVDLSQNRQWVLQLKATDSDLPAQDLTYQLGPGAPSGITLNPQSGLLTWEIDDEFANREWQIPFSVSDGSGQPDRSGIVRVNITKPDPWEVAEQNLRDCLYLVVTETSPGRLLVPLGTACAIADKQLLTSASVAHGINDARGRGWKVLAVDTRDFDLTDPKGWEITKTQAHAAYVRAESISDPQQRGLQQAFFDLAILTCEQPFPKTCALGDLETDVKNEQTVACFGFPVEEGSLSPFDSLEPAFDKVEVLAVVPPPTEAAIQGRPPFLLQLVGELPFQPFGSLVLSEQGKVLAIYAFEGDVPEEIDADPVHYAVDSVHAKAYLNQKGLDLWIETQPIPPNGEDQ